MLGFVHPGLLGTPSDTTRPQAWLSGNGALTALHKDTGDNLACVVVGRKRFKLYSPLAHARLYYTPSPGATKPAFNLYGAPSQLTFSLADQEANSTIEAPNRLAFPRFEQDWIEATVGPGQCLFVPAGWGHKVRTPTPTLMVNYWGLLKPAALRGFQSRYFDETTGRARPAAYVGGAA